MKNNWMSIWAELEELDRMALSMTKEQIELNELETKQWQEDILLREQIDPDAVWTTNNKND